MLSSALGKYPRQFLSTPSARRATEQQHYRESSKMISIHALREEGDHLTRYIKQTLGTFLSTPSARRATLRQAFQVQKYYISIHALREEGDTRQQ